MTDTICNPDVFEVAGVFGADSWVFGNADISVALTVEGAQMAPVTFYRQDAAPIKPYYISPWTQEGYVAPAGEGIVQRMRGDVFCLPFGNPSSDDRFDYSLHGDVAWKPWSFEGSSSSGRVSSFRFSIAATNPDGHVAKSLHLVAGENVIYSSNTVSGIDGRFPLGHHPMLAIDEDDEVLIGTGAALFGRTPPTPFEDPATGGYSSLVADAGFDSLRAVPSVLAADATVAVDTFPARRGFADLVSFVQTDDAKLGWSAATFTRQGYVWFSLKDPRMLPQTALVLMNRGRHYAPWNGREFMLALQDVHSYFGTGAVRSREPNPFSEMGKPTALTLSADSPTVINHIQGVAKVPAGFGRVASLIEGDREITLVDEHATAVTVSVAHDFLGRGVDALADGA